LQQTEGSAAPEIPAPGPDTLATRIASVFRLAADMAEDLIREDGGALSPENQQRARARLAAAASIYWIGAGRAPQ
jgi:hypothetical protein